jgi:two-component system, LuxR family, sensor kinase FixL
MVYMMVVANEPQDYFYLLFLPLIWIASRNGLPGAALASGVTQIGIVLGAHGGALQRLEVSELQLLVSTFTVTGLVLGIMADERERAVEELKRSLRLAAASEMAGAIAHEINQPLAALHNYGSVCQRLLAQHEDLPMQSDLNTTIGKMLRESRRAAEVVKRLRDFFRAGATRLERVDIEVLLKKASAVAEKLNESAEVKFRIERDERAQVLLADRVQIEVVLRNLLANAFEAVALLPPEQKQVTLAVRVLKGDRILFRVSDNGPGVPASARPHLFEPFSGNKAAGMGIGLSMCRAIAQAHGGSLSVGDKAHGEFNLVLPQGEIDE